MSDYDPNAVIRIPGQLFLGVTNMGAANYGGTPAGFFENAILSIDEDSESILSEADGKRTGVLTAETFVTLNFDCVQFDTDVSFLTLANAGSGVATEPKLGGTRAPGLQVPKGPILFAPVDSAHPAFVLYAPVYRNSRRVQSYGSMGEKRRERVTVDGCDDSSGRTFACALLANISL